MRIKNLLEKGICFLDTKTSNLDCELLLSYVLGVDREYLISNSDEKVEDNLVNLFWKYVEEVSKGKPIAYILKEKEFYGIKLFVDERVLIQRPETEKLIDKVIDFIEVKNFSKMISILDIGTGSGNISVALAKTLMEFKKEKNIVSSSNNFDNSVKSSFYPFGITALDISNEALEVAKINIEQYGIEDKINIFQSDLLEILDDFEKYDIIIANLPYIGEIKNKYISVSTEKYEPNIALFGGENGLNLYEKLFQQVIDKNIQFSFLIGEFGFAQTEDLGRILNKYFDQQWSFENDDAGIPRIFIVKKDVGSFVFKKDI